MLSDRRRRKMVLAELDAVRTNQRENLTEELANMHHSCISTDLERFSLFMQSTVAGPRPPTCTGVDAIRRRCRCCTRAR